MALSVNNGATFAPTPTNSANTLVSVASAKRTAGDIGITSTVYVDVNTGLDLVLQGIQVGDWIGVSLSARIDSEAAEMYLDCCSVVSGSPVNYWAQAGGATDRGVQAWCGVISVVSQRGGTVWKQAVAGDIASDGSVTIRLRARCNSGTTKTINAGTTIPLQFQAVAHRPLGVASNLPVSLSNLNTNTSDTAANSATFADVPGQGAINIPAVAGDILVVEFSSTWFGNGGARNIYLAPTVAGVAVPQTQGSGYINAGNFAETNTYTSKHRYVVQAADIVASVVAVKIQYKTSGNANIRCDTTSRPILTVTNWRQ